MNDAIGEFKHIITPSSSGIPQSLWTVWNERSLLWVMAKREMAIRFSRVSYRFAWIGLRPIIQLMIYLCVFVFILKSKHATLPYVLIIVSGFLAWLPFIETMHSAGKAIEADKILIQKSNISRLSFPIYRTLVCLPEVSIILFIFFICAVYLNFSPAFSWKLFLLPIITILQLVFILGLCLWSNVLLICKPNLHHFTFVLLGYVLWITPVFYMPEMVPVQLKPVIFLNPLASILALYRYVLLNVPVPWIEWVPSTILILSLLVSGLFYYTRYQDVFAERM